MTPPPIPSTRLVYVSGAYTAPTPEQVAENVALAKRIGYLVQDIGHEPLIPHISCPPPRESCPRAVWKRAMRSCLVQMLRCDAVLMLPNWRESRGARVERWVARRQGIPVFEHTLDLWSSDLARK